MLSFTSTKDSVKNSDNKLRSNNNLGRTGTDFKNKDGFMKFFIDGVKIIRLNFPTQSSRQVMPY